jgi:membrane-bound lytic murein transglycosylase D
LDKLGKCGIKPATKNVPSKHYEPKESEMLRGFLKIALVISILAHCQFANATDDASSKEQLSQQSSSQMQRGQDQEGNILNPHETKAVEKNEFVAPESSHENEVNGKTREKERDIMEEALQLLDESSNYWEKGDLENALDMLDQAYALILDTDGDPDIARQKDDLRFLISKRILAIYTSMQTSTSGQRSEIPYIVNSDVEKEIRQFQTVERDFFIQSYKRAGLYRPIIVRELKKAGLPEELSWLPLVESGFKAHALSKARALGLWQFIPSTGYKYGLNRDEWVDERLDAEKSTRAAIDYLRELHGMFGDWLTVLAGYNCGEGRVLRLISRQHIDHFDRFWDLYKQLPNETARYVPRFLATLLIIKDPKKYKMDLDEHSGETYSYEIVKTSKSMRLQDIASKIGTSEETLITLNSELRQKITPDKEYNLKVPISAAEKMAQVMDEIPLCEKPRQVSVKHRHRVKRGETLAFIAQKYRTSVRSIITANKIKRLKSGQYLIIPMGDEQVYAKVKINNTCDDKRTVASENSNIRYKVKKGETLASVARHFNTSVDTVMKANKLKRKILRTGQIIIISSQGNLSENNTEDKKHASKAGSYTVKKGDSLVKIARKNGMDLNQLLQMNKLTKEGRIHPGQVITIQ